MNPIVKFKKKIESVHRDSINKLESYNTANEEDLENLRKIFENVSDYVVLYICKLTTQEKHDILKTYGETKANITLYNYYHKLFGYSKQEVHKYFYQHNLQNKKVQLILQNAIEIDVYYMGTYSQNHI